MAEDISQSLRNLTDRCHTTTMFISLVTIAPLLLFWSDFIFVVIADNSHLIVKKPSAKFSKFIEVWPKLYPAGDEHESAGTKNEDGYHFHNLTVRLKTNDRDLILDLQLNRGLIPETYVESHHFEKHHVLKRPTFKEIDLCLYQGKVRDVENSWVAISTCDGLSGVIHDGGETMFLEPGGSRDGPHWLYQHRHLVGTNHTQGGSAEDFLRFLPTKNETLKRWKRGGGRGPSPQHGGEETSLYVELALVVSHEVTRSMGSSKVISFCKDVVNILNAVYKPLDIYIALVGVEVWRERDKITILMDGDKTLENFMTYRTTNLLKTIPNDNAQLIISHTFNDNVVGKAYKGTMCSRKNSGGVIAHESDLLPLVVSTMAHEMGHNFGIEHDQENCACVDERCIMASSTGDNAAMQWSECSRRYLATSKKLNLDYCLKNKPLSLFGGSSCGNGFVEEGEECDCGLPGYCSNPCCDALTCKFAGNASCATGSCCDLKLCVPKESGVPCRSAKGECDLPEFCTGDSEFCPDDFYTIDGHACRHGEAYCYEGKCRTHEDQCKMLWGPVARIADLRCFAENKMGTYSGHCGVKDWHAFDFEYIQCTKQDAVCGLLHCITGNEMDIPVIGKLTSHYRRMITQNVFCKTAEIDLGVNVDLNMVPNGAKCGPDKMCVKQKCVDVKSVLAGQCEDEDVCSGHGKCNDRGRCHCDPGFAPPRCDTLGLGGSEDSGPATRQPLGWFATLLVISTSAFIFTAISIFMAAILARYLIYKRSLPSLPAWEVTKTATVEVVMEICKELRCTSSFWSRRAEDSSKHRDDGEVSSKMLPKSEDGKAKGDGKTRGFKNDKNKNNGKLSFDEITRIMVGPSTDDPSANLDTKKENETNPKVSRFSKGYFEKKSRGKNVTTTIGSSASSPEVVKGHQPRKDLRLVIKSTSTASTSVPSTPGTPFDHKLRLNVHPGTSMFPVSSAPTTPDYPPFTLPPPRARSQSPSKEGGTKRPPPLPPPSSPRRSGAHSRSKLTVNHPKVNVVSPLARVENSPKFPSKHAKENVKSKIEWLNKK